MEDLVAKSTAEIMELTLEYSILAARSQLTDEDADRFEEILKYAVKSEILSFWIGEVDHTIGHHWGLLRDFNLKSYQDQQALLREYMPVQEIIQSPPSPAVINHKSNLSPVYDCVEEETFRNF
jgi:hypothetical protein